MVRLVRPFLVALALTAVPATAALGCDNDVGSDDADATEALAFEVLDVQASSPEAGLKVLKTKAAYVSLFGSQPPANVDFTKHWVVHVSMGMANTGGYSVEIGRIEKQGGAKKTLVVHAVYNIPGPTCLVTQAFTNPQISVRINKQAKTPKSKIFTHSNVSPCGANSACQDLGGVCLGSPIDVTFGADCQADYAMASEPTGECAAVNRTCCVPKECGGFLGLPCGDGQVCVDYPFDSCNPQSGGADCGGICVKNTPCGGFTSNPQPCPNGFTCVVQSSGAGHIPTDVPGLCVPNAGGQCGGEGDSCAQSQSCCDGLTCCAGVPVPAGQEYCGVNCPISDRNKKTDIGRVDGEAVLDTVAKLPIHTWRYKTEQPGVQHMGPMAQDFKAAFGLGATDKAIFTVDADGVALAAIQALHQRLEGLESENARLRGRLEKLEGQKQRR